MPKTTRKAKSLQYSLNDTVIDCIQDKKGEDIIILDLQKIADTITDHFIICHADNITQVRAIGYNVIDKVREKTGINPYSKEGFENCEWILIDYLDTVVHVFLKDKRAFYQLEELWSDAEVNEIANF